MKTLNPSVVRLEERIAPDLSVGIGGTIGIGLGIGVGGGTSACNDSQSSGANSTQDTNSGTCHCDRHSH